MGALLGFSSIAGFLVCIIMTIISAVKKNGRVKKWVIGIVVCFICFIVALNIPTDTSNTASTSTSTPSPSPSPSSTPTSTSASKPTPTKQELSKEGISSNVKIVVEGLQTIDQVGNEFTNAKAQGIFKILKVSITNNQNDAITVDSNSFKLLDDKKREFSGSSEGQTELEMQNKTALFFKSVNPGNTLEGYLIFDVPKDATGLVLQARGGMTGSPILLKID